MWDWLTLLVSTRQKAVGQLQAVDSRGGWWPIIRESWAGAWQHNEEITVSNVTTHATVFACVTLVAADIAKLRIRLVQQDDSGIWQETAHPAFSPVLRRPNHYQSRIQFFETWVISKLLNGNTYALKVRDGRQVVTALYVLDPQRVRPLVAPNGDVFYELKRDDLSHLPEQLVIVPATEVIHDRHNTLFHPLVGLSPIYACGLAAVQGLNIQDTSTRLFQNGAQPSGVLTAPGPIAQETADRIKVKWETNFTGENAGKVAVLGEGLHYEPMVMKSTDAQLIEQLGWTDRNICSAFKVPSYMVGAGEMPNYNNIEALNQQYYSQCLQVLIESIELALDEGLGLTEGEVAARRYGTEFDVDDLLRLDTASRMKAAADGMLSGLSPNEVRKKYHDAGPIPGGETPFLQEQNWPISQLAQRELPTRPPTEAEPLPMADVMTPDKALPDADQQLEAVVAELLAKAFAEGLYDPVRAAA